MAISWRLHDKTNRWLRGTSINAANACRLTAATGQEGNQVGGAA
jgi:hypothetical protein